MNNLDEVKYKYYCKFYDKQKDLCIALNDTYCDKEFKQCSFFKPTFEAKIQQLNQGEAKNG